MLILVNCKIYYWKINSKKTILISKHATDDIFIKRKITWYGFVLSGSDVRFLIIVKTHVRESILKYSKALALPAMEQVNVFWRIKGLNFDQSFYNLIVINMLPIMNFFYIYKIVYNLYVIVYYSKSILPQ